MSDQFPNERQDHADSAAAADSLSISVREGRPSDLGPLSLLLARSFAADPQFTWIFGDLSAHEKQMAQFFATQLRDCLTSGTLDVALDSHTQIVGAALWRVPGSVFPSLGRQFLTIPRYVTIFGSRLRVASSLAGELARAHPKEPHWYLTVLGVEPQLKGRGVGGALLRHGLARADATRHPAYLETNTDDNVALYQHFNFSVAAVVSFANGCPPSTTMWHKSSTPNVNANDDDAV